MMKFCSGILAAMLLLSTPESSAFSSGLSLTRSTAMPSVVSLQMGFFDEGKKALVKSLAGKYDQAAVRARLDDWIGDQEKPVLMLSFRT